MRISSMATRVVFNMSLYAEQVPLHCNAYMISTLSVLESSMTDWVIVDHGHKNSNGVSMVSLVLSCYNPVGMPESARAPPDHPDDFGDSDDEDGHDGDVFDHDLSVSGVQALSSLRRSVRSLPSPSTSRRHGSGKRPRTCLPTSSANIVMPLVPPFPITCEPVSSLVRRAGYLKVEEYAEWGIEDICGTEPKKVSFCSEVEYVEAFPVASVNSDYAVFLAWCFALLQSDGSAQHNYPFRYIMDTKARETILLMQFALKELAHASDMSDDAYVQLRRHVEEFGQQVSADERQTLWTWTGHRLAGKDG